MTIRLHHRLRIRRQKEEREWREWSSLSFALAERILLLCAAVRCGRHPLADRRLRARRPHDRGVVEREQIAPQVDGEARGGDACGAREEAAVAIVEVDAVVGRR